MARVKSTTIEMLPEHLLEAIWYTEGNRPGVPLDGLPEQYELRFIDLNVRSGTVTLDLGLKDAQP